MNIIKNYIITLNVMRKHTADLYMKETDAHNRLAIGIATILAIIFETYNIFYLLNYGERLNSVNNRIYFGFYLSLLLLSILVLLIQRLFHNEKSLYRFHLVSICLYLLWSLLLNSYQLHAQTQSSTLVFITALFATIVIMQLKLSHSISLIISSSLLFFIISITHISYGNFLNTCIAISVILVSTVLIYTQKITSLKNKMSVDEANQKLLEEKENLRISLEKYEFVMNKVDLFYLDWNIIEKRIVLSNKLAAELNLPKYIDDPTYWFLHNDKIYPEDKEAFRDILTSSLSRGISLTYDLRILNYDNIYAWYHVNIDFKSDKDGNLISALASLQNIDNLKKMNEEITTRVHQQIQATNDYISYLKATQEKVLTYHHDMRHILKLIDQLIAKKDMEALKDLSTTALDELQEITPSQYCANETVNLILGSFAQMAANNNVDFYCSANLPEQLKVSSLDLCSIFFNLLENALFAAQKITENNLRKIEINTYIKHNKLVIIVTNNFTGIITMKNDIPVPDKITTNHGHGVKSIIDTVEKNDGMYIFKTEAQRFVANILIPLS